MCLEIRKNSKVYFTDKITKKTKIILKEIKQVHSNCLPEKHNLKFFEIIQNLFTATFLAGLATHFDFISISFFFQSKIMLRAFLYYMV